MIMWPTEKTFWNRTKMNFLPKRKTVSRSLTIATISLTKIKIVFSRPIAGTWLVGWQQDSCGCCILSISNHFYPRDAMLTRVIGISTCLSVRPSVTRRYCVKTKKASGMISSPSDSHKTLVFWRQISLPNSKGFPPNGGLKQGSVGKIQRFSSFKRQYLENGSRYGQCYY